MRSEKFENICNAVRFGKERKVEHQITHRSGKVLDCSGSTFEVEIDGDHQKWAMENCEESP